MKPYGTVLFVSTRKVAEVPPTSAAGPRSRSDERRARYLDVALHLFLQHGFNGVSTDQLATAAGGSKATLYRYFPSKEALFEAIIDDIAAPALATEGDGTWNDVDLEDGLRRIGRATADAALDPRTISLMRLAVGEHARFPQLAATLFEHGPSRTYSRLRGFLSAKVEAGEIAVDDLQIAAEQFLGGIIGHQQLRAALGLPPPSRKDIDARIGAAVETFTTVHRVAV
jgi:TetR/AcrR family transcriptional repressor of mexJK operon